MDYTKEYQAALDADRVFQAAVVKQFGWRKAGDMRYRNDLHNAETKAAGDAFKAATDALHRTRHPEMYPAAVAFDDGCH